MPAVMIRQLEALAKIMDETSSAGQRRVLLDQAAMIQRDSERSVPEAADRDDVRRRYGAVLAAGSGRTPDEPVTGQTWKTQKGTGSVPGVTETRQRQPVGGSANTP
jgi:hypothetical protein